MAAEAKFLEVAHQLKEPPVAKEKLSALDWLFVEEP